MTAPTHEGWVKCPPGELQRLGTRLRVRRRLRALFVAAIALVAVAAVSGGAWLAAGMVPWSGKTPHCPTQQCPESNPVPADGCAPK